MDFSYRHSESELMDDSHVPIDVLRATYLDINRANNLLGGDRIVLDTLKILVSETPKNKYTLIDIGCGDGAMLRKIADAFRKKNIKVDLLGIDINEKAIVLAKKASKSYSEIKFEVLDIFKANGLKADFVVTTLTMHHIPEGDVLMFLKSMIKMSGCGIIVNDLHRSRTAYYLFKLFRTIFIKTKIAKSDGLVSIRSGFTKQELRDYSKEFPKIRHSIKWKWAYRLNWVMRFNEKEINE